MAQKYGSNRATDRTGGNHIGQTFRFRLQDLLKITVQFFFPSNPSNQFDEKW